MTKQSDANRGDWANSVMDQAPPFRRMLVAVDGSEAAAGAFDLSHQWAGEQGAEVRFVELTGEHRQHRSECESDVNLVAVEPAQHVVVRGPTLGVRNRMLVRRIAEAAAAFEADVIVLGFDQRRLASHRLAPSLREQITRAVDLPVLVAPTPQPGAKPHLRRWPVADRAVDQTHSKMRRYAHV